MALQTKKKKIDPKKPISIFETPAEKLGGNGLKDKIQNRPGAWGLPYQQRKILTDLEEKVKKHLPTTNILDRIEKLIAHEDILKEVEITPEMALDILTWNKENRPIPSGVVFRYASEMRAKKWIYNGDSIRISKTKKLIDGQTRLYAIIISGLPQTFNIQGGLSDSAYGTIDYGKKRTAGDVLAKRGHFHANALAAAIKQNIYFERHLRFQVNIQANRVTNQDVVDWLKERDLKLMEKCIDEAVNHLHKKGPFLANSTWGFVYFTLSLRHRSQATEFINLLASGAGISPTRNNAIYLCREKLMHSFPALHQRILQSGGSQVTEIKVRYIFRAWNAWRTNEKLERLSINTREPKMEKPI